METTILKMLDNAKNSKLPISYFTNRQDSDLFSVGLVISHDNDFLMTSEISPEGKFDGYSLQKIESIYRIDIGDSYVKELSSRYSQPEINLEEAYTKDEDVFDAVLRYLKKHSVEASFCLNEIRETDFDGKILDYDKDFIYIQILGNGIHDGETVIKTNCIYSIIWDSRSD